ncbi:ABC transporter permease [Halalkalicoccus tibetensis]|uniref:ABC transporter permease n=1 Tax=Halalkalicoccus tibetensis TaxID=175632 RepID=A0ABD5VA19_9EURY
MELDLANAKEALSGEKSTQTKLFLVDNFIWVLLVATVLAFGIINGPQFFNYSNLQFIVFSSVMLSFLVMAEGICLLSGNFDLSVGQAAGFAGMLNALLLTSWAPWMPWWLGVITILFIGALIGAFNGFFIAFLDLNPFLVTLGTFFILQYATLELSLNPISEGFPATYLAIGGDTIAGIPIAIFVLVIAAVLIHILMRQTQFGSNVYSVGGDSEASNRVGISVTNTVFWVFVISGVLSAFSGLLFTGFLGSATPGMADGAVFMAFAGAVIGGASLTGGRGSIVNMIGGALLIGVFDAGLIQTGLGGNQVNIFFGVLVIAAIIINRYRQNIRDDLLTPS